MKIRMALVALLSSLMTLLAAAAFRAAPAATALLENNRVRVTELVYQPGVPRERSIRQTDQIIVFVDACRYERTDPDSGEKTIRERRQGEVIWHNKGEVAPVLKNLGTAPYRTLVVELR
jgi:hypothetical protein